MRNKIETNKKIFDRLWDVIPNGLEHNGIKEGKRYIETDERDCEFIKRAVFAAEMELSFGRFGALISCPAEGRFAVLPGAAAFSVPLLPGAKPIDWHPGWVTILAAQPWFALAKDLETGEKILNQIFGKREKFQANEIIGYFLPFHLVDITGCTNAEFGETDLARIAAASVAASGACSLALEPENVATILQILADDQEGKFAHSLYRALTAAHWVHAYLEIYRCVEAFFPEPYMKELSTLLAVDRAVNLQGALVEVLNWRPKEDSALEKLLRGFDGGKLENLRLLFECGLATNRENQADSLAKRVYRLRNEIAHHRRDLGGGVIQNWRPLISGLLAILRDLQVGQST